MVEEEPKFKYITGEDMLNTFISEICDAVHRRYPIFRCSEIIKDQVVNKMTKTKCAIAAVVIGILMVLVLPACAAAPIIDTATPGLWLNGTDLNIYISGHNFPTSASNISVVLNQTGEDNITAIGITINSDQSINPAFGTTMSLHFGNWNLTVNNLTDGSNDTLIDALYVYNPSPTTTLISPASGTNESNSVFFTLIGTGFFPTPEINLSAVSDSTNITGSILTQNSTGITGTFNLLGASAQAGRYTVNLTNPDGNVTSNLYYDIYCPTPIINNVTPSGNNDQTAWPVVVNGNYYLNGAIVNITNGSTQISTTTPAYGGLPYQLSVFANIFERPVGLYNVTVINPGPLYNNTTSINAFRVFYPAAPVVNSINPTTIVNTSNATGVQIFGTGFKNNAAVVLNKTGQININATSVIHISDNLLTCNLTTNGAPAGVWNVIVTNNDTQSSNADKTFTITPPPVPVASFTTNVTSGTVPLNVRFNDTSTNAPAVWNWSFGDGQWYNTTVFANRNVTHQYANTGTYTAKLTVSNNSVGSTTEPGTVITVLPTPGDKVGFYRNGVYYLASNNTAGGGTVNAFNYGIIGDVPVVGDWTGTDIKTPGIFRNGMFYLRNSNTAGVADTQFNYGQTGDVPVSGHWTGGTSDTVGVFRNGVFYLRYSNTPGGADNSFAYGQVGDVPVVGDWTGSGTTTVGVFRNGTFFLKYSNTPGVADLAFAYGQAGDVPVVGDWDGSGTTTIGVFRNGTYFLRNSNTGGVADTQFTFGQTADVPVSGKWS